MPQFKVRLHPVLFRFISTVIVSTNIVSLFNGIMLFRFCAFRFVSFRKDNYVSFFAFRFRIILFRVFAFCFISFRNNVF